MVVVLSIRLIIQHCESSCGIFTHENHCAIHRVQVGIFKILPDIETYGISDLITQKLPKTAKIWYNISNENTGGARNEAVNIYRYGI